MNGTRVVVADTDEVFRKQLREMLKQTGYLVVAEAGDAKTLLHHISKTEPDVVILDVELAGFESLQLTRVLEECRLAPVVLTMPYDHRLVAEMAGTGGVFGILVKPVQEAALLPTLESAVACFKRVKDLEKENGKLRRELETRKLVERAKGLLMENKGMTESAAYRYLQKLSMDRCMSLGKVAKQIIISLQK